MQQSAIPDRAWGIYNNDHAQKRAAWIRSLGLEGSVLDVGCGDGFMTAVIAETAGMVLALDITEEPLAIAYRYFKDNGIDNTTFAEFDPPDIPLGDNECTSVCCFEVLEHVEDPLPLIRELVRVSAGMIYVSVPAHGAMVDTEGHIHDFTEEEISGILHEAGAQPLSVFTEYPFTYLEASCV